MLCVVSILKISPEFKDGENTHFDIFVIANPGAAGYIDPMRERALIICMFLIPLAFSAGEKIDQFGIVSAGGRVPLLRQGETFRTSLQVESLRTRQGKGSVTWSFNFFLGGNLYHSIETESYSGFQEGDMWNFSLEKNFTVPLTAPPGDHRIEIILRDNNSGTVYEGSVYFYVTDEHESEAAAEAGDDGMAVFIGDVSVRLSSVGVRDGILVCTFIAENSRRESWLGFRDGLIVDSLGREHQAIIGGTIQGDGWGGLNLAAGIPMKGEVLFDSYAAGIEAIDLLEIQFDRGRKGQWRGIPKPYP